MAFRLFIRIFLLAYLLASAPARSLELAGYLPSWRDTPAKLALLEFVTKVTDVEGDFFVPPERRIAVFDNDGTLWSEEPWPVPLEFVFYRIRKLSPEHPDWANEQPYKAVLANDTEWLRLNGRGAFRQLSAVAQAGISTDQYEGLVQEFLANARHPGTGLRYADMAYVPMLELIKLLQAREFEVYVVSGGDLDFIRAYAPLVYGVARANIIGSHPAYKLDVTANDVQVLRQSETGSVNVGGYKVVNIHVHIGQPPIAAFGNSDGDLQMLRYATSGDGLSLAAILDHDDGQREFAVSSGSARLAEEAKGRRWLRISMKHDFDSIYRVSGQ
jgi:phosphoserine phosphatase